MNPTRMHQIAHAGCHSCSPKGWRDTPNLTGDYDLDETIVHRSNPSLPKKLELYVKHKGHAYGPRRYGGYGAGDT
jgi:hypothetical protein